MPNSRRWTRDELLLAFRLYCRLPFGQLHSRHPEIIQVAKIAGRTPSAIAMKACNFASLDPMHASRGVQGLRNASVADRQLWADFKASPDKIALAVERAFEESLAEHKNVDILDGQSPSGPSEVTRSVKIRRLQGFFRSAVLAAYDFRCAASDLDAPELINASHIIPWSVDDRRRADPCNGIALNVLYDRAFDRGLMTIDVDLRLVVASRLRSKASGHWHETVFGSIHGRPLRKAIRFGPDPDALEYHRDNVFRD
jgi:putative restriction endonuclease